MDETKFDWSDLRLFLAVARGGGLAAGAKLSGQSAPTLSRHMSELEHALGEELFDRLPQGYVLTDAGRRLLEQTEAVELSIMDITKARKTGPMTLPVRISAGSWMTWFLTRHIHTLTAPGRVLVFSATEALHNIGRRETLIGIRNQRPTERGLAARKTTSVQFAPYASQEAADMNIWVGSMAETPSAKWVRAQKGDKVQIQVSHPRSLLDLALSGAGQVVLPCFVGDAHDALVRSGEVIDSLSHEQWLVVHGEERHLPEIRETVDRIAHLITTSQKSFSQS